MLGPFIYNQWSQCEAWADGVRFHFNDALLVEVFGGVQACSAADRDANIALCERERSRIEAACRKALARAPSQSDVRVAKPDFVDSTEGVRLVLSFPDSKTAQQFAGWVYSLGYSERSVSQNTVTVVVLRRDRDRITQEVADRKGSIVAGGR
jgi:hypothetical protein